MGSFAKISSGATGDTPPHPSPAAHPERARPLILGIDCKAARAEVFERESQRPMILWRGSLAITAKWPCQLPQPPPRNREQVINWNTKIPLMRNPPKSREFAKVGSFAKISSGATGDTTPTPPPPLTRNARSLIPGIACKAARAEVFERESQRVHNLVAPCQLPEPPRGSTTGD